MSTKTALIVGSGFEAFESHGNPELPRTRFGTPSAPIRTVSMAGLDLLVLPRHGDQHEYPPHLVNYRANLVALAELGADTVIALNTVGVVSDVCESGELAIPDQVIDCTWGRAHTIHDAPQAGFVHVEFTDPLSSSLRRCLLDAAAAAGVACVDGGVYAATQGPRLETAAEVDRLERDGADFVGMTAMPEAAIAAELELEYACLSLVVNRAAGRGDKPIHDDVEMHTLAAREKAMRVIEQFCKSRNGD